jgi:hypothetical protein
MKTTDLLYYETPLLEVVEVDVEQGFAVSENDPSYGDPFYDGFDSEEEWW